MSDGAEYESSAKTRLVKIIKVDTKDFVVPASVISIAGGDSQYKSAFYPCAQNIKTVTFETGSNLNTVGGYLFADTTLETIDMTPCTSLHKLGFAMFFNCKNIKSVKLPPNLETITQLSFSLSSIASLDLPDTTKTIESIYGNYGVFSECKSFTTLNIRKTSQLQTIGNHAFMNSGLTSIYIPASMKSIGGGVFIFTELSSFDVSKENTIFSTDGNVLFEGNCIIATVISNTNEYTIREDVTFGYQAFRSAKFSKIKFAGNKNYALTSFCFSDTGIQTIELPSLIEIISETCFGYSSLESIVLPESCREIYYNAFVSCTRLVNVTLPEGLETIRDAVFTYDRALRYIEIPSSVINFGQGVFKFCHESLFVNFTNSDRFKMQDNLLINNKTVIVEYLGTDPNYEVVIPEPCTLIGYTLFSGAQLKSLRFANPAAKANFGHSAFAHSTIQEITFPTGTEEIKNNCFEDCSELKKITLAGTFTTIPWACFLDCVKLETLVFNSVNIDTIEERAFKNTPMLKTLDLTIIPLASIKKNAFEKSGILAVKLPSTLTYIAESSFISSHATSLIVETEKITELPVLLMANSVDLETVDLGSNIQKINSRCFENCTALTGFTISPATTTIEMYAFAGCSRLEQITIPKNSKLDRIKPFCFDKCTSFNKFVVEDTDRFNFDSGVLMNANKTQIIFYIPVSESFSFVVPGTVTTINPYAFHTCTNLKEVIIPDGVIQEIGVDAFRDCINLKRIVLPKSLKKIGEDAFNGCVRLECGSVTMENKQELIEEAKRAKIPEGIITPNCLNVKNFVWFGHFAPSYKNVCANRIGNYIAALFITILA